MVLSHTPYRMTISCRGFLFDPLHSGGGISGLFFIVALLLCLFSPISAIAQDNRGIIVTTERTALVIGNNAYQTAPLKNPVNDADDMSRALSALGFRVTLLKNVDRRSMEDSIRSFGHQLKNGGVGLFYFAGHGMQVEGRNYLIPVNARIESESDIKYEAVDAGFVLGKMEDANNPLNIVILDACRNNPFSRNFRNPESGLARMDAPTGSLIAYSTAPGSVAADGTERNGIFTKHLIRHLQKPNLTVEQVLKRVRIDVAGETKQRQIPWESSSLMGDFYFKTEKIVSTDVAVQKNTPGGPLTPPQYASLPPEAVHGSLNKDLPKLAVLPMYFRSSAYITNRSAIEKPVIEALKKVLKNRPDFETSGSFYDLGKDLNIGRIKTDIINEDSVKSIFEKEDIFSVNRTLNYDQIENLAKKLKVDIIFLFEFGSSMSGYTEAGKLSLYLVDVTHKKKYFDRYAIHNLSNPSYIATPVEKFFSQYLDKEID
jgi:hypothetical protein